MIFLTYLDPVRIFSAIQPDLGHVQPQLLCAFIYGFLSPPKAVSGTRSKFLGGHATRSLASLRRLGQATESSIRKTNQKVEGTILR